MNRWCFNVATGINVISVASPIENEERVSDCVDPRVEDRVMDPSPLPLLAGEPFFCSLTTRSTPYHSLFCVIPLEENEMSMNLQSSVEHDAQDNTPSPDTQADGAIERADKYSKN